MPSEPDETRYSTNQLLARRRSVRRTLRSTLEDELTVVAALGLDGVLKRARSKFVAKFRFTLCLGRTLIIVSLGTWADRSGTISALSFYQASHFGNKASKI